MHRRIAVTVAVTALTVAALLSCGGLSPHRLAGIGWHLREALFFLVPLIVLSAAAIGAAGWALSGPTEAKAIRRAVSTGVPLALLGIVWVWWAVSYHEYQTNRIYYAETVAGGPQLPQIDTRVPYQMATEQARSNLGDVTGNIAAGSTTYLPRRSEYATLVERKGWHAGYEAVLTQAVDEAGDVTSYTCKFDHGRAGLRDNGWFGHSLARAVNRHDLGVRYTPADLWGYCDGITPMVVVPLKRQVGWVHVIEKPAGYALYNGATGELEFHGSAPEDSDRPPGPTYPLSIAARQREALKAPGGYADWWAGRTGWEPDPEDVNSGNATEFTVGALGTNDPLYVTPLTGRGSATAISGFALLDATLHGDGRQLAHLSVYQPEPVWKSTKALESRIKNDYQDLPNWSTMKVFELAPTGGDGWVATIGVRDGNTVSYRIRGNGSLDGDQATCLHHPKTDARIRCGRFYVAGDPPAPGEGPPGLEPPGIRAYSDDEIVGEIKRRLGGS